MSHRSFHGIYHRMEDDGKTRFKNRLRFPIGEDGATVQWSRTGPNALYHLQIDRVNETEFRLNWATVDG